MRRDERRRKSGATNAYMRGKLLQRNETDESTQGNISEDENTRG